jgi:hypothetical protein
MRRHVALVAGTTFCVIAMAMPESSAVPEKARVFSCTPTTLSDGRTLTIHMSVPHPWELGVWTPDGEFHFLASCEAEMRASSLRSLDCDAFAKTPEIKLSVATLEAPFASSGYATVRAVFRKKGRYTFLLAKNLETENDASSVNRCVVTYSGGK